MKKPEPIIDTATGILLILTTGFAVLAVGAIAAVFSTSYESSCTPNDKGVAICTQTVKFQGWAAIPLQPLAGAIGVGIGAYAAVKSGKLPKFIAQEEEPTNDLPG